MTGAIRVEVRLWCVLGQSRAFRQFEDSAMRVMKRYGLKVLSISHGSHPDEPDEVHEIWAPTAQAFEAYLADGDLAAMSALRQQSIARTEVIVTPLKDQPLA